MHSGCLLSRLLKQKYFPSTDVLNAVAGPRISFTWRSLLEAREVIIAGSRWHVGIGCRIRIWQDRWIPQPLSSRVIAAPNTLGEEAMVDAFVDANGSWNMDLLHIIFMVHGLEVILGITRVNDSPDQLRWHYEKHGRYSVKSAYCLIF
ncbi:UNVERIFIED_CONTAM: hypothetical protein Slati_2682700 [Sesamum latifolium]|uniref:Uncharacterized protein n=1 Tax=Sesamum latifolium TaxID=2727402 RepID=A0AAW2VWY3_9LAMI